MTNEERDTQCKLRVLHTQKYYLGSQNKDNVRKYYQNCRVFLTKGSLMTLVVLR